jgi:hypothetical protein
MIPIPDRPPTPVVRSSWLFTGAPRCFNHFHELAEGAATQPDWKAFQFTTAEGGNVSRQELESAATLLDERTYRQEFEASFENLGVGRAYYAFDRVNSVRDVGFSHQNVLCWSLDINMNPLCSVLAQFNKVQVHILEEMVQPDSNTLQACEEFLSRTEKWRSGVPLNVYVYGDATGEQRRTSASRTDWQIVKNFFGRYRDRCDVTFRVPSANPPVSEGSYQLRERPAAKPCWATSAIGQSWLQTAD